MAAVALSGSYASYPAPPGDKRITMKQIAGPASYTVISVATPPTGGIAVKATDIGLVEIEAILGTPTSDDGQYYLVPMPSKAQTAPQIQINFMAVVANTGAQVSGATSLSARTFIIVAIGN